MRSIQSTNSEKMFLQMILPRSLLRKFLVEDFLSLLLCRRFEVRDVDIILHSVPSKLKFPDFVFVLVASASKRFASKHNLNAVKASVLSRLKALIDEYAEEFSCVSHDLSLIENHSVEESDIQKRGSRASGGASQEEESYLVSSRAVAEVVSPIKISDDLKAFGIGTLRKQDHVLKQIYFLYALQRRDKRINFESLIVFTKDFNISPGLISNSECFEIFEAVLRTNGKSFVLSKQPAINYQEFICLLFEIAIVSNCFGEEDHLIELTSKENIWKKVLNFLWFLESSKERSQVVGKILLPNFKINRNFLIVEDRLADKKEATNLELSILKFKTL